ncbi:type IV pilus assembly protein PilX [Variovorax sp. HW608]|uniref:pilus assembly PilX family protein n=1 Tax=Variovorax sp. HW608 TaxID=1034889 RepID=UPI00081FC689|nr:PilX N-terminal domain-containing pilus assembly protein [Variovorax sp. HW608]SCK52520.1 type IV pilus assembly protein PilX [Variovorax sp. HW608]
MNSPRHRQQGISLFVVMVMVMLTTLIAMWGSRTALLNEMVTGNDSDYQRALEAAQAMVRDAELDITGQKPDGTPCKTDAAFQQSCRETVIDISAGKVFFPQGTEDYQDLEAALAAKTPSCIRGICLANKVQPEFWKTANGAMGLDQMKAAAAHYGDFTGAVATANGDPSLVSSSSGANAWYWVEVLPYDWPGLSYEFMPDKEVPYVYRITGIALGRKAGTQAVVQTVFVWRKNAS